MWWKKRGDLKVPSGADTLDWHTPHTMTSPPNHTTPWTGERCGWSEGAVMGYRGMKRGNGCGWQGGDGNDVTMTRGMKEIKHGRYIYCINTKGKAREREGREKERKRETERAGVQNTNERTKRDRNNIISVNSNLAWESVGGGIACLECCLREEEPPHRPRVNNHNTHSHKLTPKNYCQ